MLNYILDGNYSIICLHDKKLILICLIIQQKQILKMQQVLIPRILLKQTNLANLKSDKLDIDKLKDVPTSLTNLKSKVDKSDVDILVPVPVDLSKLSDLVKDDVVKKDVFHAYIKNIEDKIAIITNLATNTTLNAKINEVKNEIPIVTNLVTYPSLNAKINEAKGEKLSINNLDRTVLLLLLMI